MSLALAIKMQLQRIGQPVRLRHEVSTYDPTTRTTENSLEYVADVYGSVRSFDQTAVDGTNVLQSDRLVKVSAADLLFEPAAQLTTVTIDGTERQVIGVPGFKVLNGERLYYELQVR